MKFYMNLENWIVPNSLPKACSTLVPKPDKDNLEKKNTNEYTSWSYVQKRKKKLSKVLANPAI